MLAIEISGNMSPYVLSYLKERVDPDIHLIHAVWLSGVCLGIQGLVMPLVGFLAMKMNVTLVIIMGCLVNRFVKYLILFCPLIN